MTTSRLRVSCATALLLAIGLLFIDSSGFVRAAGPCKADSVVLGQMPGLTGATPTDWFNVFGENLDPSTAAVVKFDVPVIPWSIDQPKVVQAAVSTFTIPTAHSAESFKWTFRPRDAGVPAIRATVNGPGCEAVTRIDFSPPATSMVEVAPDPGASPPHWQGTVLALAFGAALFAANRRFSGRRR